MKPNYKLLQLPGYLFFAFLFIIESGCNNSNGPVGAKRLEGYSADAVNSILLSADSLRTFPFTSERADEIKKALQLPNPVLLYKDSMSNGQQLAQIIALNDPDFIRYVKDGNVTNYINFYFF